MTDEEWRGKADDLVAAWPSAQERLRAAEGTGEEPAAMAELSKATRRLAAHAHELVERDRPALSDSEVKELVRRYLNEYRISQTGSPAEQAALEEDDDHAWDTLMDLIIMSGPSGAEQAWPVILGLIEQAPDDKTLAYVAAGPLEDFIQHHGERFADRILIHARRDERFRSALGGVWGWETVSPALRDRVRAVLPPSEA